MQPVPVPDHALEQYGLQHHCQQGPGCHGEDREGAATEGRGSLPTVWLERTAATKRGYEDDSEKEQSENTVAPKKLREGFKNKKILGGGGKKPLKNPRLTENSTPSRKKLLISTSKLVIS